MRPAHGNHAFIQSTGLGWPESSGLLLGLGSEAWLSFGYLWRETPACSGLCLKWGLKLKCLQGPGKRNE